MAGEFVPLGTLFQIGDAHSGETFTTVSGVQKISGMGWSRDMKETTALDSSGGYRTYLPSFRKGEVVTINLGFTAAGWDKFRDIFETQAAETDSWDFRIVLKAGSATTKYTWEFQGFIQSIKLGDINKDDFVTLDVEIQITGAPTEYSARTVPVEGPG